MSPEIGFENSQGRDSEPGDEYGKFEDALWEDLGDWPYDAASVAAFTEEVDWMDSTQTPHPSVQNGRAQPSSSVCMDATQPASDMTSVYGGTEDRADTGPGNTSNTALPGEGGVIDQKFETGRSNAAPEHLRRVEGTDTNATPSDRCGHQAHEGAESAMIENGDPPFTMPSSEADSNESKSETAERLFEIRPSKLGGLGAFALRELWKGDIILVEEPLLKTTHFGLRRAFDKLSEPEKQIYMNLHCGENCSPFKKIEEIKQRNSFLMKGGLVAIFATASRFNHACRPVRNVKYELDGETGVITLTVCQDVVPAGTELTVNYGGSPAQLYQDFGFICKCGGCDSLTADDIRRMRDEAIGIYR